MNKVIAVVVTYNRLELLKQCISAVENQSHPCDILIVNNASTDDTELWATEYIKTADNIHYINTGANIGGAGGFNKGMRWSVENGYDFVWIMDDDCIPKTDTLENLVQADASLDSRYGYLSSVVLWTDGSECKMNRQKFKDNHHETKNNVNDFLVPVVQSTFVSLFFPASTIRKVGLPIKEFFIWGDDVEYTRRIAVRNNMPSFMVSNSTVIHAMKENNGSSIATDVPQRIDRYKYAFRNENYLYRQEGIKGFCYYVAKCGLNLCRIIVKSKSHKIKRCGIILNCMIKGLGFNPEVEKL